MCEALQARRWQPVTHGHEPDNGVTAASLLRRCGMATTTRPDTESASSLRTLQDVSADSYSTAPSRGASAAPSRYSTSGNNSRSSARNGGLKFGFLDMGRLQHCLRLRKSFGVTDQLSGEVGLDYNLSTRSAVPQYSLAYEVRPGGSCA